MNANAPNTMMRDSGIKSQPINNPAQTTNAQIGQPFSHTPISHNGVVKLATSNAGIITHQPNNTISNISPLTQIVNVQPHATSNVTLADNSKRKLEPTTSIQSLAKRPTIMTNTHNSYINVNPRLASHPKSAPNQTGNEVTLNETRGNVNSDYPVSLIPILPTPTTLSQPFSTEVPYVQKEEDTCGKNSPMKNVLTALHAPIIKNSALPENPILISCPAATVGETGQPPSSLPSQTISSIKMIGKGHDMEDQIAQQQREQYHMDRKRKFLTFTKTLMRYLEVNDKDIYLQAKCIIRDCADKKKQGDLNKSNLGANMQFRLRKLVGENIWKKTEELLSQSLMQDLKKRDDLSPDDAKAKAEEVARVAAAPLCGAGNLTGQPGVTNSANPASCTLQ